MTRVSGAILCALFAVGSVSVASADDTPPAHQYQVRLPKLSASCADEAAALGARLAKATGASDVAAVCTDEVTLKADGQSYTLYTITVSYSGDKLPQLYSADYGRSDTFGRPDEEQGVYATYADCLAARAAETATFEAQTGLSAVATICEPGRYTYDTNYVLRIDGFGKPQKTLQRFEVKYLGDVDATLDARVEGLMTGLGAVIVNRVGNQKLYYAPDTYAVKYDLIAKFNTADECKAESASAQDIYTKLGSQAVVLACLPSYGTSWYLQAVRDGYYYLSGDEGSANPRFYSYEECARARSRINFNDQNQTAIGGICHASDLSEGQYELELFSRL